MGTLSAPPGFCRVARTFAYLPRPAQGVSLRRLADTELPPPVAKPAKFEVFLVETNLGKAISVEGFRPTNPEGEALLAAWGGYGVRREVERYFLGERA